MWSKLIKGRTETKCMDMIEKIRHSIVSSNEIFEFPESIFNGKIGHALFLLYHYQYKRNIDDLELIREIIDETIALINQKKNTLFTFAGGLSGLVWFINHAKNKGIDLDFTDSVSDINNILSNFINAEMKIGNYDYMHGAIGASLPIIESYTNCYEYVLQNLINLLKETSIVFQNTRRWHYFQKGTKIEGSNLGLSHGIPSILSYFIKCYELGINRKQVVILIEECINFIFSKIQDAKQYGSFFPYSALDNLHKPHFSRLAWCYGDLGICWPLLKGARILKRNDLVNKIHSILAFSVQRKSLKENLINDASICHGTSGLALLYNRYYHITNDPLLKMAVIYWVEKTLDFSTFEDGICGYKLCTSYGTEYLSCSNYLEGVAGIGLSLISCISNIEPEWDISLMI